jgi:hypothetical protein
LSLSSACCWCSFRLHKEDEDDYIVRSNTAYYIKRSVSTELELEAGMYWVLLKITAKRFPETTTVEDVIAKTWQFRREKLLQVGLSYDLALAKGNFRELVADKARSKKQAQYHRRHAIARRMHDARAKEHKKQKFRHIKMDLKKQDKAMHKIVREAESRARNEAAAAAVKLEDLKLSDDEPAMLPSRPSRPPTVNGGGGGGSPLPSPLPSPGCTAAAGTTVKRRETLAVEPPQHSSSSGGPLIRVQRASIAAGGRVDAYWCVPISTVAFIGFGCTAQAHRLLPIILLFGSL